MERLDILLIRSGYTTSRSKAKSLIEKGRVKVRGKMVQKASFLCRPEEIEVLETFQPTGRGYYKLETALDAFSISVQNKRCLDVGASTGGFTELLLERGASHVVALDVGRGQLATKLQRDSRVTNMEGTNFRYVQPEYFSALFELITIDVSFISLEKMLPKAFELLTEHGEILALIKPQFERKMKIKVKNGVVRDPSIHQKVIEEIRHFSTLLGLQIIDLVPSKIVGGDGNQEFLIYLKKHRSKQ